METLQAQHVLQTQPSELIHKNVRATVKLITSYKISTTIFNSFTRTQAAVLTLNDGTQTAPLHHTSDIGPAYFNFSVLWHNYQQTTPGDLI